MRWIGLALVGALGLGGCATVKAVNRDGGVVEHVGSAGAGMPKAEAFCAQTGRTAHVAGFDVLASTLTFDCVARSGL